jgi:hypothetical protein
MKTLWRLVSCVVSVLLLTAGLVGAQSTTGTIQGIVIDQQQAIVPGATVTIRNVETNLVRTVVTGDNGQYRAPNLPTGLYEVAVELPGFARVVRDGIRLTLNQTADVNVQLQAAGVAEEVTITADAPLLNRTNAEVGVMFDSKRMSELPLATNRNVMGVALSAPGVSQLGAGQTGFASGVNFSSNGMRVRSNNFMIDGQDSNDPSVTGMQGQINNPDIVQEVRLITNQFAAEFGRAAGSVMNIVTKSGTNSLRGSVFMFHNREGLNARSNTDKRAGRESAPFKRINQWGGTAGGPILRDRTFFFAGYQRWNDEGLGSGTTLNGAPTAAGRQVLQTFAGHLPQVQALLSHLPAGSGNVGTATFTLGGVTHSVELGSLTGSAQQVFENDQLNTRIDHQFGDNHRLSGRYMFNDSLSQGAGSQVTPPGLLHVNPSRTQSLNTWLTSVLGANLVNETRFAYQRLNSQFVASDPKAEEIPSIEIPELGLTGFNAAVSRTAIGLGVNLPQYRIGDTYQFQNSLAYQRGSHGIKGGVDVRWLRVESFFVPTIRGRLVYPTLQRYIDDVSEVATINRPLPGGQEVQFYDWTDFYVFLQDEWRIRRDLTLSFGVRYELPGNSIAPLYAVNDAIVEAAGGDQRFSLQPRPSRDTNNIQPRLGFNWNPRTESGGLAGLLTGGDKMVVRGGYSRTHDYAFININLNIASSFPYVASITNPANFPNAFTTLPTQQLTGLNPMTLTRTVVSEDFRSPYADQFSLEMQRELGRNLVGRVGYVGTRGKDLFQTIDANPMMPNPLPGGGFGRATVRQDPTRGVIRMRANTARSTYDSLQTGLEKRLSGGLSAAVHYTFSRYLDLASEIFNPSSGEVAVAQDPFDREADWGRSSYDRPHRFTANVVYELPFMRDQQGILGKIIGGWQVNGFLTFQSGAPFTVLNGADPNATLAGIDGLVGNAIRPNLNTDLNLSKMTVEEILAAGGRSLFSPLTTDRVGNVGRNTLRADGIQNLDLGFIKNHRFGRQNFQLRVEMFNATNTRNFGIPEGRVNSANFLNQWGTNGGNRSIWVAGRWTF